MFGTPDMRGMMAPGTAGAWFVAGSLLWLIWVVGLVGLSVWVAVSLAGIRRELAGLARPLEEIARALRERGDGAAPR